MPIKNTFTTEEVEILSAPLPEQTETYTVISHAWIIKNAINELHEQGFEIKESHYKSNSNGQIAQGIHKILWQDDPDMGMIFAWSNSYDKSLRFRCAIGAYVHVSDNGMMSSDFTKYARKHTGEADIDALQSIKEQISKAPYYFKRLVEVKNKLINIQSTPRKCAEIIGRLYAEKNAITLTQAGIVRNQMIKSSFDYKLDPFNAWVIYNYFTHALKESHPGKWFEQHELIHDFFLEEFGIAHVQEQKPVVNLPTTVVFA